MLAGIALLALEENGLIGKVNQAKQAQIKDEMKEKLTSAISELQTEKGEKATLDDVTQEWANNTLGGYNPIITNDASISGKKITMQKSGITGKYIIDENLNITEIEENISNIEFSYDIYERIDNKVKILIHVQDKENGLARIEFPDGDAIIVEANKKEEKAIDYQVEIGTECKIKIISENGATNEETIIISDYYYQITKNLGEGVEIDNIAVKAAYNKPYQTTITVGDEYIINKITVTMGEIDITSSVVDEIERKINIPLVTGDITVIVTTFSKKPATTIAEAQSDYMLTKTVNSTIEDANENKITIPAGFKIKSDDTTNNATTVDKGIVIIDSNDNEFVWIPVGKIYTDTARTEANARTIGFNRYTFDSNGNPTAQNDAVINYCQELASSTKRNSTAKDINAFKTSVTTNGGYYIGRYEARKNSSGNITEKSSDSVWNKINQPDASTQAKNMYKDATAFTSDLMNSYAWDTATLFLQTCGTNSKYSRQKTVNSTFATKGTNDTTKYTGTQDVQCNVYDMASNVFEWTTETSSYAISCPYVCRGGSYYDGYTSHRVPSAWEIQRYDGFRPLLYV